MAEMVSLETTRVHYGIWRWRLELTSSNRLVGCWRDVDASTLHRDAKTRLMNIAWSLAALERSYHAMSEDALRAERARNDGVPPIMSFLTGPYESSLEYLMTMGLWIDLGDVLTAYRTVVDRFQHLKGPARKGRFPASIADVEGQLDVLRGRIIPALSPDPVALLANRVLHEAWHPTGDNSLHLEIRWRDADDGRHRVDFGPGEVREQVAQLVEATIEQVGSFVSEAVTASNRSGNE